MFTGIIEATGRVSATREQPASMLLSISSDLKDVAAGESVAINGVCLTATERSRDGQLTFTLSDETLRRSNLGSLRSGDLVNIERAMLPTTRLSGHWVQGHIDGTAELVSASPVGDAHEARFRIGAELGRYCVEKGSIALDGVSLTVNAVNRRSDGAAEIAIMLIPYTWEHTRFHALSPGAALNVEVDIIAKYVERLCQPFNQRWTER
jgi:riboflavin synthase